MKYVTVTAIALLAATPALAQSKAPSTDVTTPNTAAPANKPAPQANPAAAPSTSPAPATANAQNAGATHFVTNEGQDQWLVGSLWNKSVYNAAGKSIGELKDVLVDRDGKVAAVVVGVGGFLGLGEKNVAVDYSFIKEHGGISPNRIVLNMTEQELRSAPSFTRNKTSNNR